MTENRKEATGFNMQGTITGRLHSEEQQSAGIFVSVPMTLPLQIPHNFISEIIMKTINTRLQKEGIDKLVAVAFEQIISTNPELMDVISNTLTAMVKERAAELLKTDGWKAKIDQKVKKTLEQAMSQTQEALNASLQKITDTISKH